MNAQNIVFDLDGTLIDSSASILDSLNRAFEAIGISPSRTLNQDLIGPPLPEIIDSVLSILDKNYLPEIINRFKKHYDEVGYLSTHVYEGVHAMLQNLHQRNFNLYVATNKRNIPTHRIIKHLGWQTFFKGIYSLDSYLPPLTEKSTLLQVILNELSCDGADFVYIGDRTEDSDAARFSGIPFFWAAWGYGESIEHENPAIILATPAHLITRLNPTNRQ
jgi:phosphoglycolate phosphatase